jgi:hypothetical protein
MFKIVWGRSIGFNIELNKMVKLTQPVPGKVYMDYHIITDGADCYPWTETFVILPKKTITGKRLAWQKLYKRKVWVVWGTGFHMEPETQYATLFEILDHGTNKTILA